MPPHSYSPDNWNRYQHLDVRPANAALGAEVRCGDLRQLSDAVFAEIRQAWLDHLVLVFHGQTLTGDELLAVGARFGTLDDTTRPQPKDQPNGQLKTNQALSIISNVKENGEAIGALGDGDLVWHTDMSYIQRPPDASLLYALEVPSEGGQTGFSNMYLAFETLPADLKALAATIKIKHDATHNSAGRVVPGSRIRSTRQSCGAL